VTTFPCLVAASELLQESNGFAVGQGATAQDGIRDGFPDTYLSQRIASLESAHQ
jgi:hypothetical protein